MNRTNVSVTNTAAVALWMPMVLAPPIIATNCGYLLSDTKFTSAPSVSRFTCAVSSALPHCGGEAVRWPNMSSVSTVQFAMSS